jgi:hypothetical protein
MEYKKQLLSRKARELIEQNNLIRNYSYPKTASRQLGINKNFFLNLLTAFLSVDVVVFPIL